MALRRLASLDFLAIYIRNVAICACCFVFDFSVFAHDSASSSLLLLLIPSFLKENKRWPSSFLYPSSFIYPSSCVRLFFSLSLLFFVFLIVSLSLRLLVCLAFFFYFSFSLLFFLFFLFSFFFLFSSSSFPSFLLRLRARIRKSPPFHFFESCGQTWHDEPHVIRTTPPPRTRVLQGLQGVPKTTALTTGTSICFFAQHA